ncbi:MAG: TetR/AcrR family transcriptional regulator [Lachnospiraceae bacterium]|nr:TetR/AcrR family transcriptional regulator [Lachnospiraceae bacterium]
MGYDFDNTHDRILESALRHFTEEGFRNASIRQICRDAGVTNGAFYAHFRSKEDLFAQLVEPALRGFTELYSAEVDRYTDIGSAADVPAVLERSFASGRAAVGYVYAHAEAFRLLLQAAGGTAYEDLRERLTEDEKRGTTEFFERCRPYVARPENLSGNIVTQASVMIVSTVFDCFLAGMTQEETAGELQLATEFCLAGLRQIWGI